jgi:hypothetical protein
LLLVCSAAFDEFHGHAVVEHVLDKMREGALPCLDEFTVPKPDLIQDEREQVMVQGGWSAE